PRTTAATRNRPNHLTAMCRYLPGKRHPLYPRPGIVPDPGRRNNSALRHGDTETKNRSRTRTSGSDWLRSIPHAEGLERVVDHFAVVARAQVLECRRIQTVGQEMHGGVPEQEIGAAGVQTPEVRGIAFVVQVARLQAKFALDGGGIVTASKLGDQVSLVE